MKISVETKTVNIAIVEVEGITFRSDENWIELDEFIRLFGSNYRSQEGVDPISFSDDILSKMVNKSWINRYTTGTYYCTREGYNVFEEILLEFAKNT